MNHDGLMAKVMQKYWGIKKVPYDELTKDFLKQCQPGSVELNGKHYKYYQKGNGPTVVLVHGLHSNLGSMVPIAQDLIGQGFKIALFDAPAHGEAPGTETNPAQIREVFRKIGGQIGEIRAMVCHSLGGFWSFCAWGDDFRAETFVSIASPATHKFLVEKFVQLGQLNNQIAEGIYKELERLFGERVWVDFSPSEIVKSIGVPGLIIHGKNDDFVPPAHAGQLHASWANAKLEMMEGLGHFDVVTSPKARALVTSYLREFQ
ncbi:MAG: alpha/beta fold hydrolase [Sulfurifustaceae bacterium]